MELCLQVFEKVLREVSGKYRRICPCSSVGKDCMSAIDAGERLQLPFLNMS